jgi:PhoPQ-activated pathogenicity-related protein
MSRRSWLIGLLSCLVGLCAAGAARADLAGYVKKQEQDYAWKHKNKRVVEKRGTVYHLELVSQKWQGIVWTHDLMIYVPKDVKPRSTMFLLNTGGKITDDNKTANDAVGFALANNIQSPVAFLFGIPNQPLFKSEKTPKGLVEDALIAETFVQYLKTKDDSWPLLFPMVKSVVKAMDALQAFVKKEWQVDVKDFVLTGASKRGWTTWLTASVEPRVKAIAPMVIDTLNMQKQMVHQKESYGAYSEMIDDYVKRKLVPMPDTPEAKRLWSWVDPWVYRKKFTMPKLILNGTNDPYWTQDALNLYFDDLPGEKYVSYVPNAGHGLVPKGSFVPTQAGNVLAAFSRAQIEDKQLPKLTWKHDSKDGKYTLTVNSDVVPKTVRLWSADAATKDFRKSEWKSETLKADKKVVAEATAPKEGCRVFFVECEYEMDKLKYSFCTQVRIVGEPKKKDEK